MNRSSVCIDDEKLLTMKDQISELLEGIDREELIRDQIDSVSPSGVEMERIADRETDLVGEMTADDLLGFIAENDLSDLEKVETVAKKNTLKEEGLPAELEPLKSIEGVSKRTRLLGFELLVSRDRLRCYVDIIPMYYGCPPQAPSILDAMAEAGINFGIESPFTIANRVRQTVETEGGPFIAALGNPPRTGRNASVKYLFDSKSGNAAADDKENIDYHETGRYTMSVAAGELLAVVTPPSKGEAGKDIFGKDVAGQNGREAPLKAGKNVARDAGGLKFYATAPGQVFHAIDVLSVSPVLTIDGDLDYSVGNIDFKGSVRIKGNVLDGFRVRAGGDVIIDKSVEGAFIECGGNLTVRGGIVGRGVAQIECSGSLRTGFIENANVVAEGNIIVVKGIIHSEIMSNGNVIVTDVKGKIVGGRIIARNLVESNSIGSQMEVKTQVWAGRDAGIQKMLWGLAEKKDLLAKHLANLNQLDERTRESFNGDHEMPENIRTGLKAALEKRRRIIVAIGTIMRDEKRYKNEMVRDIPGRIKVEGVIFPNTRIEIGFSKMQFNEPARKILLAEDKNCESIIILNLYENRGGA